MAIEQYIKQLKEHGYKTTSQRKAILNVLLDLKSQLLSIDDILSRVIENEPETNRSTIYRNMDIFESVGIVHKTVSDTGVALYDLVYNESHHHHMICKKCGKAEAIDYCPMHELLQISESKDFILTDHKLELYGYCKECFAALASNTSKDDR